MGAKPVSYTKWDSDVTGRELPPPSLAGYEILGEIGRGSMGMVYEAKSAKFGSVAVKVLNILAANGDMAVERFRREVTVGARIGHASIPTVYDSGSLPDGRFFLVMELLRGCDLEDWWEEPGHTRAEALDLICEALEPLAAAHQHGVVHRDLKPENLFVEQNGTVRLLDFGVARDPDASQNLRTATGISVGTPVYMSPEQATKPTEVDTPADVWSVGVMLYEALCGELPFDGESPHAVILHACTLEPTPLLERVPEVHGEVRALVDQCLQKNPLERAADAGALHALLAPLLQREDVRQTLVGPAAAPSFRLSHSTAPTKIKQDLPLAAPAALPLVTPVARPTSASASSVASTGELESLTPAQSSKKFAVLALLGLAAAAVFGIVFARMDTTEPVAGAPGNTESSEAPTTFAAPPEPETLVPAPSLLDPSLLDPGPEVLTDAVEQAIEEGVDEAAEAPTPADSIANVRRPQRAERVRRPAPLELDNEEPEDGEDGEELPADTESADSADDSVDDSVEAGQAVTAPQPTEPAVVAPPAMAAEPRPTPMRPPVVTMRPRMRPTMRTQPTETRPERPGFVTF